MRGGRGYDLEEVSKAAQQLQFCLITVGRLTCFILFVCRVILLRFLS